MMGDTRYYYNKKYSFDTNQAINAAKNGKIQDLINAYEMNCRWSPEVCSYAAGKGHYNCLVFANQNNCPWDIKTPLYAAKNNKLDCLKYAIENNCPVDENAAYFACSKNNYKCLNYILEKELPVGVQCWYGCAKYGSMDCMYLLDKFKIPKDDEVLLHAVRGGNVDAVWYLIRNNCPWEYSLIDFKEYDEDQIDCLRIMYLNRYQFSILNTKILLILNISLLQFYIITRRFFYNLLGATQMKLCGEGGKWRLRDINELKNCLN